MKNQDGVLVRQIITIDGKDKGKVRTVRGGS